MSPEDKITGVDVESFEGRRQDCSEPGPEPAASRSLLRRQGRRRQDDVRRGARDCRPPPAGRGFWRVHRSRAFARRCARRAPVRAPRRVAPPAAGAASGTCTRSSSTRAARLPAGCATIATRSATSSSTAPGSIARTSTRCWTCRFRGSTSSWGCIEIIRLGGAAGMRYDDVVVDTAPTGHTLRLLASPETVGLGRARARRAARGASAHPRSARARRPPGGGRSADRAARRPGARDGGAAARSAARRRSTG